VCHGYISLADLKRWTPAQVVKQIAEEANDLVASGFTLSMSNEPIQEGCDPKTPADYEKFDFVEIGTQVGFSIKAIGNLWNGLSNVALHMSLPQDKQPLSPYGNVESIRAKVGEALDEFKKFEKGSLVVSEFGRGIHFKCDDCDSLINRNADLLKDGQVISCFKPSCDESYTVQLKGDEVVVTRRTWNCVCKHCAHDIIFPSRKAEKLRYGESLPLVCECCNQMTLVQLRITQERPPASDAANSPTTGLQGP
jgi:hypothetical protein